MIKTVQQHRLILIGLVWLVVIGLTAGCAAGSSFGLSTYVPVAETPSHTAKVDHAGFDPDGQEAGAGIGPGANQGEGATPSEKPGHGGTASPEKPGHGGIAPTEKPGHGGTAPPEEPGHGGTAPPEESGHGGTAPPEEPGHGETASPEESGEAAAPPKQPGGKPEGTSAEPKLAALTFDDGPDARYTTAILDILKEKGVKATFFVVGIQVDKHPDVLQRIVDEGHVIGNHTQGHKNLSKLSRSQIVAQIAEADEAIENTLGAKPELFRAPYGAVSDTLKKVLAEQNRRLVGWTVDTRDWAGTSIEEMRDMIAKETKANGIILLHSFGGKHIQNTVDMLPDVIDDLHKLGFTLVTADQIDG